MVNMYMQSLFSSLQSVELCLAQLMLSYNYTPISEFCRSVAAPLQRNNRAIAHLHCNSTFANVLILLIPSCIYTVLLALSKKTVLYKNTAHRVLSILPERPVRDQWDYLWKVEPHFLIKQGQPRGMALLSYHFLFLFRIPYINEEIEVHVGQWNGLSKIEQQKMNQNKWTTSRWSPKFQAEGTKMDLSIWLLTKISRIFGINGKDPHTQARSDTI